MDLSEDLKGLKIRKGSEIVAERARQVLNEAERLAKQYSDYDEIITKAYRSKYGRDLPENVRATTLQALDTLTEEISRMDETTRTYNMGSFVDYGYQLISAVLPNLVTNEIASIQPLKVRSGDIFFMDFQYPQRHGNVPAGTTVLSSITGPSGSRNISTNVITNEPDATGNGTATVFNFTVDYPNILPGTVKVTSTVGGSTVTATDDGNGNLVGSGFAGTSTVNYTTGAFLVAFTTPPDNGAAIQVSYQYQIEMDSSQISEVTVNFSSMVVNAAPYKLKALYSLDAAFDAQQAHGINLDSALLSALAALIRSDIDNLTMDDIYSNAAGTPVNFNGAVPNYVAPQAWYNAFVPNVLIKASAQIFQNTKVVEGNFVFGGVNAVALMSAVDGFEGVDITGDYSGPHVAGTIRKKWKVIVNPNMPTNNYCIGHKGGNYLTTGYVFAPYRALYVTPPIILDDDTSRRGMAMSAGRAMVNPYFYVTGTLSGF